MIQNNITYTMTQLITITDAPDVYKALLPFFLISTGILLISIVYIVDEKDSKINKSTY